MRLNRSSGGEPASRGAFQAHELTLRTLLRVSDDILCVVLADVLLLAAPLTLELLFLSELARRFTVTE
jgi:hypothetical protein